MWISLETPETALFWNSILVIVFGFVNNIHWIVAGFVRYLADTLYNSL